MIVVDSSVWINYFNGNKSNETDLLDNLLGEQDIIIGDIILTEVLQGFKNEKEFKTAKQLFDNFNKVDMVGQEIALLAAENYRKLRKKDIIVRKTIDVLIATFCIKNNFKLLYSDKDFDVMKKYLGLKSLNPY